MSQRLYISPLYGRYMPYVKLVCPRDPVLAHYTDAICHMSGCYVPRALYKPNTRTLYAICQDALSQRPSISPLYGRYMPYVRMVWPKDPVSAHYTDAICHMSGCYVPETQFKTLYGRYMPYVRMLCPRDPV